MSPRKVDPTRARRKTGHRPAAGKPARVVDEPGAIALVKSSGPPAPPDDLEHPHARAVWEAVVLELYSRGLREVDYVAIRMLARQAAIAFDAALLVDDGGMVVAGAFGQPMTNPAIRIERDAATLYLRFAERFGLDLASRMRLGLMQLAGESLADALSDDLERE